MVLARAPLRLSFAGGGTDLPSFYTREGGAVVSTAISRYIHVAVNTKFGGGVRVSYSRTENVKHADEVEHPIVRECLKWFGIDTNIEIVSIADIPSEGSGLGSSSSFTVALIHALAEYTGTKVNAQFLAKTACYIEIDKLGEPIGKQDQWAAAYGRTNTFTFHPGGLVDVTPLDLTPIAQEELDRHMLLLWTGRTRAAKSILTEQSRIDDDARLLLLRRLKEHVPYVAHNIYRSDPQLVGAAMDAMWTMKKRLANGISDAQIDTWYDACLNAGAYGGKILGAGGGGFLLMVAPPEKHMQILAAVPELSITPITINAPGSSIVYKDRD